MHTNVVTQNFEQICRYVVTTVFAQLFENVLAQLVSICENKFSKICRQIDGTPGNVTVSIEQYFDNVKFGTNRNLSKSVVS